MTKQEIEEFVAIELSDINLSTKEKEKIVNYIKNQDNYYAKYKNPYTSACNNFLEKWEICIEIFRLQGFDEKNNYRVNKKCHN